MIEHGEIKEKCRLVANDYQQSFDKDLVSVILYGSAITQEYSPKKSDLNFLIVLSEDGIEKLNLAHELAVELERATVCSGCLGATVAHTCVDGLLIENAALRKRVAELEQK